MIDFETDIEIRVVVVGHADAESIKVSCRGVIPCRAGRFAVATTASSGIADWTRNTTGSRTARADKAKASRMEPEYLFFLNRVAGDLYEPVFGPGEPHLAVRRVRQVPMTDE